MLEIDDSSNNEMNDNNQAPSSDSTPVMVGGFRDILRRRRRVAIGLLAGVILLVLLGWFGYVVYRQINPPAPQFNTESFNPERMPKDFTVMTDAELAYSVYHKIGLTSEDLRTKDIDASLLDTFEKAYIAAQALHGMDDQRERAYRAYGVAADQAPEGASHEFYIDYAEVALLAGKPQEAINILNKAKEVIQADGSISEQTRQSRLEGIDEQIYFIERNVL